MSWLGPAANMWDSCTEFVTAGNHAGAVSPVEACRQALVGVRVAQTCHGWLPVTCWKQSHQQTR
jgi:hypothetical protein